jgi:putative transposase
MPNSMSHRVCILGRVKVRYTYRLRPGQAAQRYLAREWGMCRFVWNRLVEESAERFRCSRNAAIVSASGGARSGELLTFGYAEQDKFLTGLRSSIVDDEGCRWLAAGSSVAQQQTVRDFAAARAKALADRKAKIPAARRRGLPRFKSRHRDLASMNYTRRGFSLVEVDGAVRLQLPGKVRIPIVWSRELPSEPASARVYLDSLGHWYVSFVVEIAVQELSVTADATPIGIDWGVSVTATTTSDAHDLPHAQHGKSAAAKLARYQRMMARRRTPRGAPTTKGYAKARRRAALTHAMIGRRRVDDARKWAKKVVRDHDQIAVEDFRPAFLARSTMARKAADARIAAAKAELAWQANKHGRDLRLVNPAYTTMDCSSPTCGARTKHRLHLSERTYSCEECGLTMPRDKNSAAVMVARAFGHAATAARPGLVPADAEGISPEPAAAREPAA